MAHRSHWSAWRASRSVSYSLLPLTPFGNVPLKAGEPSKYLDNAGDCENCP